MAAANPDVRAQAIDEVVGGEPSADEASGVDTPAAAGPVGETPMSAEPRDVMRDSTQSPPSAASPTSSATQDGGAVGGSVAPAGPDSPPATRPPARSHADPIPMSRSRTNEEALIVRSAPAHLESKLRFWEFSVGQIAAAFAGIMLGAVWAKFLSPLHGMWGAMSGAYIAALPVIPVFVASQTEFDLFGLVTGAVRWRRLEGRYLPGGGVSASGYLLLAERADGDPAGGEGLELELPLLWDEEGNRSLAPVREPEAEHSTPRAFASNGKGM